MNDLTAQEQARREIDEELFRSDVARWKKYYRDRGNRWLRFNKSWTHMKAAVAVLFERNGL